MIVDDHSEMRRTLKNFVKLASVHKPQIFEFETGEEALKKYLHHMPDFTLLDIELQTISGFEVAQEIMKKDSSAKVIMVTSYNTPGFRQKAKRLGVYAFVSKDNLSELQPLLNNKEINKRVQHEISE